MLQKMVPGKATQARHTWIRTDVQTIVSYTLHPEKYGISAAHGEEVLMWILIELTKALSN